MSEEESYAQKKWGKVGVRDRPNEREKEVIDRVVAAAAIETGIAPANIVGRRRLEAYIDARFIMYDLCMKSAVFSQSHLGRCLGKHHGAIWNGTCQVGFRLKSDESAFKKFRDLHDRIERRYEAYESDPERMVQELSIYDGRQGDDLPPKA